MRRVVALAAALCPAAAHAGDCMDKASTQTDMNACAAAALTAADSKLNSLYGEIEGRLAGDSGAKKELVAAQRAWLAFRDAECAFASSGVAGGSVAPMIYSLCLEDQTQRRARDFDGYLKCAEGDLSCPVPPK